MNMSANSSSVRWSGQLLDTMIAPGISTFTVADIPDLDCDFPESSKWMSNHFLNNVFRVAYPDEFKHFIVNAIFRAQSTFRCYREARAATLQYLENHIPTAPRVSSYFLALSCWEAVPINLAILTNIMKTLNGCPVFEKNDGSIEERVYGLAADIRHVESRIKDGKFANNGTIPVWLTNDGLSSVSQMSVQYTELARAVSNAGVFAREVQDAQTFAEKARAMREENSIGVGISETG